jgi:stress response protein YsnF
VVKEEVVVKKRAVEETEQVEAELQKERIDIDESGRTRDLA